MRWFLNPDQRMVLRGKHLSRLPSTYCRTNMVTEFTGPFKPDVRTEFQSFDDASRELLTTTPPSANLLDRRSLMGVRHNFIHNSFTRGVLLYEFSNGALPFSQRDTMKPVYRPGDFPNAACKDLCESLLVQDWRSRIGCGAKSNLEIKEHLYFQGVDWEIVSACKVPSPLRSPISNPPTYLSPSASMNTPRPSGIPPTGFASVAVTVPS